jgi:glucan-binding YG repeat protein
MRTGWLYDGGSWYYMNRSGAMVTGRQLIDGTWYNFNASGAML